MTLHGVVNLVLKVIFPLFEGDKSVLENIVVVQSQAESLFWAEEARRGEPEVCLTGGRV